MATTDVKSRHYPAMSMFRKLLNKPKKSDPHTLAVFYHANDDTKRLEALLVKTKRRGREAQQEVREVTRRLRQSQQVLMDIILQCVEEAVPQNQRASRDFRVKYPDDMVMETLNGGLWQSAEILASGQSIVNRADQSIEIRPLSRHTLTAIGVVRDTLTKQALASLTNYSPHTRDVLRWFDHAWAEYEHNYVSNMCPIFTADQFERVEECVVMFSEATQRAIRLDYLSQEMLEMYDPSLMFSIPRLAIVCGLVIFPHGPLDLDRKFCDIPECFRVHLPLLARIRELLRALNGDELTQLEKALCSAEGIGVLARDSDGKPIRVKSSKAVTRENDTAASVQTTEDSEKPKETKDTSVHMSEETIRIRSAFQDSTDMLHRLFVAISGVADQLQTNNARDMRLILKGTFAVCEDPVPVGKVADMCGDIVPSEIMSETVGGEISSGELHETQCEANKPTGKKMEGHFHSGQSVVSSAVNVSERASVQEPPVWIPDIQSNSCSQCKEKFTLIRRRHHCRNCGKLFCGHCAKNFIPLPHFGYNLPVRVCSSCNQYLI